MTSVGSEAVLESLGGAHGQPDWQIIIGTYLAKRLDMNPIGIFEVLKACEVDEIERMRYMKIARGAMP